MSHKIAYFFVISLVFPIFLMAQSVQEVPEQQPESQESVDFGDEDDLDMLDGILDEGPGGGGNQEQGKMQQLMQDFVKLNEPLSNIENKFKEGALGDSLGMQEDVNKLLAELIEELRPTASQSEGDSDSQDSSDGGGGGGPGQGGGPANSQVTEGEPTQGAPDSVFRSGSNKVGDLRKFVEQKATSSWGKLPPKERKAMEQEMREKLPQGNSEWVEKFYKLMASGEAK